MGYRHYMYSIDKSVVEEIKDMSIEELNNRFTPVKERDEDYFYHRNLPTEEIYELGKYIEFADQIQATGKRLFSSEDTHKALEEYDMYVIGKEGFLKLIEIYQKKVIDYYKSLLVDDKEDDFTVYEPKTSKQKQKYHIESTLREWERGMAINLSDKTEAITHSWKYEYSLFELVKVLKTFDFENKAILFYGW